jgi:hypothetical protein
MSVLINQKDCLVSRKNLGIPDCIVEVGIPRGFIIVPKGWNINLATDTFDKAYVDDQIQQGNFIPVMGAVEFTNNTPESTTEEAQGGVLTVVRKGLPQFSFKFWKGGWRFASALQTWDSQQAFDVLFAFENGCIAGSTNGTVFAGFDMGMLDTGSYMFTDGNTQSSVSIQMQLINASQYNKDVAILTPDVLDFRPTTDLQPITDIVMTGTAAASTLGFDITASFDMNQAVTLGGIASSNLRLTINGVVDTIVSVTYDSVNKTYNIVPTTALVAGNTVVVQLYDSVNTVDVAKIGSKYYKGATPAIVVTA